MISALLSRNNLLAVVASLACVRLIILPTLDWQEGRVEAIEVKARQADKVATMIDKAQSDEALVEGLRGKIEELQGSLFAESESFKLGIQQSIRKILTDNDVVMTSFEWSYDEYEGPLRTLRATVLFNGSTAGMMRSFVLFRASAKLIKIPEWQQRFTQRQAGDLGMTRGSMVIELYTMKSLDVIADMTPQSSSDEAADNE
jgi:hypothetical protein